MSGSTAHRILKSYTFRIVLGEPGVGGILAGKDLQVIDVANLFVAVDPDGHKSSLISRNISMMSGMLTGFSRGP